MDEADLPPIALETPPANGNMSALEWLRERHEALKSERTREFEVPGYTGRLVLECRPVPWSVMSRIQPMLAATDRDARGMLVAMCDAIIAACVVVKLDGEPIGTIGPELAALFGDEVTTARGAVEAMFPNGFAINALAGELLGWTQNADADSAGEFTGE